MEDWINTVDAAKIAKVTRATVVLWCKRLPGVGIRVGGRWRVDPDVLEDIVCGTYDTKDYDREGCKE